MRFAQRKIVFGMDSTATSGGTKTLVATSLQVQLFTGASNHNLKLPDATTMVGGTGIPFVVLNFSTGTITVQKNDNTTLTTLTSGQSAQLFLTDNSTSNGTFRVKTGIAGSAGGAGSVSPGPETIFSGRAVFGGGQNSGAQTTINYIQFSTQGNATAMGALSQARYQLSSASSTTRGIFAGGSDGTVRDTIDYVTITALGTASAFGSLTQARYGLGGGSNETRAIFGGGFNASIVSTNVIDYITIASPSSASSFGTLSLARNNLTGTANATRMLFVGGSAPAVNNTVDFVQIATLGNAVDFGDLTVSREGLAAASNQTRSVFGGGFTGSASAVIDFVQTANLSNASAFGNLSVARYFTSAAASQSRALFAGGNGPSNVIDSVIMSSQGNAADVGDLTTGLNGLAGLSNCHGGLF